MVPLALGGRTQFWYLCGVAYYNQHKQEWALAALVTVGHVVGTAAGVTAPPDGVHVTAKAGEWSDVAPDAPDLVRRERRVVCLLGVLLDHRDQLLFVLGPDLERAVVACVRAGDFFRHCKLRVDEAARPTWLPTDYPRHPGAPRQKRHRVADYPGE